MLYACFHPVTTLDKCYVLLSFLLLYYRTSMLSWHVKNENNLSILHAIVIGLALINCVLEGACHTWNSESLKNGKVWKEKTAYILNGIPFKFSAHPCLHPAQHRDSPWTRVLTLCRQEIPYFAYRKFNTGIYDEVPTHRGPGIGEKDSKAPFQVGMNLQKGQKQGRRLPYYGRMVGKTTRLPYNVLAFLFHHRSKAG